MTGTVSKQMMQAYYQDAAPTTYLCSDFTARPENFHNTEEIEIDIERSGEDVAIAVQDMATGYNMNSDDLYTNKKFEPPVFKEGFVINSHDLMSRMAGENPFDNPSFRGHLIRQVFSKARKVQAKIRRAMELQAAQVWQTGKVSLTDAAGKVRYAVDFKPKASHFPTAGTAWNAAGSDKIGDLQSLIEQIRDDGQGDVTRLRFGIAAFESLISDDAITKRLDTRRVEVGAIVQMQKRGLGENYRGTLEIGNYKVDLYTYGGRYKHPQTGVMTQYLDKGKVIADIAGSRMDATFGAIPNIGNLLGAQSTVNLPELPARMSSTDNGMDMYTNVWLSPDGETLNAGVGARPMLIPTAIDTFGCLDTGL